MNQALYAESVPDGSQGKVWYVIDEKTRKELGIALTLVELDKKFGREGVVYGVRWYFPETDGSWFKFVPSVHNLPTPN